MTCNRTLRLLLGRIGGHFLAVSIILLFTGCVQTAQNHSNVSTGNGLSQSVDANPEQMANRAAITECQLLFSEEEVARQGIARQRLMYPSSSR
ncbi:MAG: hypothetical protein K5787_09535, partial [Lentisphaeria bacterium]|nr:hypothetical protein [Lentisphaeria bacterium]